MLTRSRSLKYISSNLTENFPAKFGRVQKHLATVTADYRKAKLAITDPEQHRREALRLYKIGLMISRSQPSKSDRRELFNSLRHGFRANRGGATSSTQAANSLLADYEARLIPEFTKLPIAVRRWLLERPCFAPYYRLFAAGAVAGTLQHRQSFRPLALMALGGSAPTVVLEESLRGQRFRDDTSLRDVAPGTPLPEIVREKINDGVNWMFFNSAYWHNNPKPWEAWGMARDHHPTEVEFKAVAQRRMDAVKTLEMLYFEKPTPDRAQSVWKALPVTLQGDYEHSFDIFHESLMKRMSDNPAEVFERMCEAEATARANAAGRGTGTAAVAGKTPSKLIGVPTSRHDAQSLDMPSQQSILEQVGQDLVREERDAASAGKPAPKADPTVESQLRSRLGPQASPRTSAVAAAATDAADAAHKPRREQRVLGFGERAAQVREVISKYGGRY